MRDSSLYNITCGYTLMFIYFLEDSQRYWLITGGIGLGVILLMLALGICAM